MSPPWKEIITDWDPMASVYLKMASTLTETINSLETGSVGKES